MESFGVPSPRSMSSMVAKCVPLRTIFRAGNSQKSLGARSGDYGGWVMTRMLFSARNAAQQLMCGSVRYRGAETTLPATCRAISSELHRATPAKLARRNDHRTHQISLRVTFVCSLLLKWASRGHVSQPRRTSNRKRRPNSGRIQKKPSAGASNNGRVDGASLCVRKGPTLKVIR